MSDSENTTDWVSVAEAADKAHVDTGTVRQWYRSGRLPTRRSEGRAHGFLVPLDLVLQLVEPGEPVPAGAAPSIEEVLRGLDADHRSTETESAKEELASARTELAALRREHEFLRSQVSELAEENRSLKEHLSASEDQRSDLRAELADVGDDRTGVQARLATVESELSDLRRTAARSSITDNSWLDQETPAYESPVRRQAMAKPNPAASISIAADGPTAPYDSTPTPAVPAGDLSDLLATTRPDDIDDERPADFRSGSFDQDADPFEDEEYVASRAVWTDEAPHPALGEHDDDLFPEHDKKGRFGKK